MYLNGTAENHKDLLNIFRQFAEGYGVITYPITYAGTGNGVLYKPASPAPGATEVWTLVCTTGGGHGVGIFSVTGSVSGAKAAATVGTFYVDALFEFVIQDGATDFVVSDQFDITVTQSQLVVDSEEWAVNRWCPPIEEQETSTFDFPTRGTDGNASTEVSVVATSGIYHMKFPDATDFDEYSIVAENAGFDATEPPYNWTLEYSDDGTNWTVTDTQVAQVFTIGEQKDFAITPGRHLYYRLNVTVNNGGASTKFAQFFLHQAGHTIESLGEEALLLQGQGLAGTDEIYINIGLTENIGTPYFNWNLYGSIAFDADQEYYLQPGTNSVSPNWVGNDNTMEYWLTGNGRYIQMTTKVATVYTGMMVGLFLPYAQPAEYPYPLLIAGSSPTARHYTSTSGLLRMWPDPGENSMMMRSPGGTWLEFDNNDGTNPSLFRNVWPFGMQNGQWNTDKPNIGDGIDGTYVLYPCLLAEYDEVDSPIINFDSNLYGEIQDVFMVSGRNNSAENIIDVAGVDYICFPNIFRINYDDFYCVRIFP